MSYAFTVVRDDDGLRLAESHESALAHIPHGEFRINGHVPAEGTSKVATIAVTLVSPENQHVGSASASYTT